MQYMWCDFDWNIFQIITEMFTQFIQLCCVVNVFIAAKFVVARFPCFFKHWTWLYRTRIRISNNTVWFEVGIDSGINNTEFFLDVVKYPQS